MPQSNCVINLSTLEPHSSINSGVNFTNVANLAAELTSFKYTHHVHFLLDWEVHFFAVLQIIISVVGVFGNCILLLSVLQRRGENVRPYDIFLGGIIVSNVVLLGAAKALETCEILWKGEWFMGDDWCKTMKYLQYCFHVAGITFHITIALDRYLKLAWMKHKRFPRITKKTAKYLSIIITVTLLLSFIAVIPNANVVSSKIGPCQFTICLYTINDSPGGSALEICVYVIAVVVPYAFLVLLHALIFEWLVSYICRINGTREGRPDIGKREKTAIMVITISGVVLITCWGTYVCIYSIENFIFLPGGVTMSGRLLGVTYTAITPYIYGTSYKTFPCKSQKVDTQNSTVNGGC